MKIPILQGIYLSSDSPDFRVSLPKNMIPIPQNTGIDNGYLRPAEGIMKAGEGPGLPRGAINWNNIVYRVMGGNLVKCYPTSNAVFIGNVGGLERVRMAYSFDRLAIAADGKLFYYDGTLTQVTDSNLGFVDDVVWVDGYFMTTDGEYLVVTELNDPYTVSSFKYGSSEIDPDPILCLLKVKNEVYALNRYTVEVFKNVGTAYFPFQRVPGAEITRGCVGRRAAVAFNNGIAYVGSGKNEQIAIWYGANGQAAKISNIEVDRIINSFAELVLRDCFLENRFVEGRDLLYVHLPNQTLVYDVTASQLLQIPVWYILTSGLDYKQYQAIDFTWCYDQWNVAQPNGINLGIMTNYLGNHWGNRVAWEFDSQLVYNQNKGAVVHEIALIGTPGRSETGDDATIWSQYSTDGVQWSQKMPVNVGTKGERNKKVSWRKQGIMRTTRIQKISGTDQSRFSVARLEATLEPLNV